MLGSWHSPPPAKKDKFVFPTSQTVEERGGGSVEDIKMSQKWKVFSRNLWVAEKRSWNKDQVMWRRGETRRGLGFDREDARSDGRWSLPWNQSADCAKTYNPEKWSLHSKKHKASSQAVVTLAVNWNELIARTVIVKETVLGCHTSCSDGSGGVLSIINPALSGALMLRVAQAMPRGSGASSSHDTLNPHTSPFHRLNVTSFGRRFSFLNKIILLWQALTVIKMIKWFSLFAVLFTMQYLRTSVLSLYNYNLWKKFAAKQISFCRSNWAKWHYVGWYTFEFECKTYRQKMG